MCERTLADEALVVMVVVVVIGVIGWAQAVK